VDDIFEALSHCASLHPDANSDMDDDDDAFIDADEEGFEVFTGAEGEELSEVGRVRSDFISNSRYAPY
jgi:chloride channel, nucleotide-sensitive, 1A